MRRLDMSNAVCVMMCTHEWESCLKRFEGVETMDLGTLSRRVRRENPDLSSPLTKIRSPQILSHFHRLLELRAPRRPRLFAKRVQKWATSKEKYHAPLCGYAFSRMKSTPHHPSQHVLRRHGIAKSLGLLRPPQFTTTTARQSHHHSWRVFAITFHSMRVWFRGGFVFFDERAVARRGVV